MAFYGRYTRPAAAEAKIYAAAGAQKAGAGIGLATFQVATEARVIGLSPYRIDS